MKKIKFFLLFIIVMILCTMSYNEFNKNTTYAVPLIKEKIVGGLEFTVLLKDDGTVWTWGTNDAGQLGQNDRIDRSQPTLIPISFFANKKVIDVNASNYGVLAKTETGDIYSWGVNTQKPVNLGNYPTVNYFYQSNYDAPNFHSSNHILVDGKIKLKGSGYQFQSMTDLGAYSAGGSCAIEYNFPTFFKEALYSVNREACPTNSAFERHVAGSAVVVDNAVKLHRNQYGGSVIFSNSVNELYIGGNHYVSATTK